MTNISAERIKKVFQFLKERSIPQKEIAIELGEDECFLSELKNGKRNISREFVERLHKKYYINPNYIYGDSEIMITPLKKLEQFDQIVEKWDTVESKEREYLHLLMDRNFYDYLLEVNKARAAAADGISSEPVEIQRLAEMYAGKEDIQEFVILPRDCFIEILTDSKEKKKYLTEAIDLMNHIDYLEIEK